MYTLYKLNSADLNDNFLNALKLLFSGKTIEIAVREIDSINEITDIWQAIQHFRQQMHPDDYPENEDIFTNIRDRSSGRDISL